MTAVPQPREPREPRAPGEERVSEEQKQAFADIWTDEKGFRGHFREINNVPIARRYMITGFAFFLMGGLEALLLRIQLGTPDNTFLSAEAYNQIFTMHGTTMMFLFVIPFIEALANYMLPLLLGTRDLPFPRLTALSYWTYLFGGIFLYSSFLFGAAPDGGWFSYLPLNNKTYAPGINMDFWDIGLSVAEVAALGAAAELIVGVLRMRAAGMTLDRLPLFAWAMLVTAFMILFAFTPLIVGTAMLELDRKQITAFFEPSAGGEPLLWQHLFWVFGHPEVYIMFVPAVGIVSHIVQTFTRRPLVSYTAMVLSTIATGFISFGLWVHHMFTTGLSPMALGFFTAASLLIVLPNGVQVFGWIATLWFGRPRLTVPLLYVFGFLVIFVLGGLTGVMTASVPVDAQIHDSYFVVAHFHYVLIGGVVFPLFAGLYYWLPKIIGRMLSERLGKWNFWMMFVFFNVAFFPMHFSGMLGMPRRVYTYDPGIGLEIPNFISTVGALGFATGISLFLINLLWSWKHGAAAGRNPWRGDSLEWSEESPPADAQFPQLPVVTSRHPLWDQDTMYSDRTADARAVRGLDWAPTRWRGAICVSVLEARPLAWCTCRSRSTGPSCSRWGSCSCSSRRSSRISGPPAPAS
jgi:cytochrome c oxidase subunit I+III